MIPRSAERPKTIILTADLNRWHKEGRATQDNILPGMLVQEQAAGEGANEVSEFDNPLVERHATAGGATPVRIVKECTYDGRTINDPYVKDDVVFYQLVPKGGRILCRVAGAFHATRGMQLGSGGDGYWRNSGTTRLVEVKEDYDNSAATSGDTLVVCEVIN